MRAWPRPDVPELSALGLGRGHAPAVHDTASGERIRLEPPDTARMYVCGITPYDATHLGHAATYLAFDLLERVWLDHGTDVDYVQNVTDIDDPLLERATETGLDWQDLAQRETDLFRTDMTALGVLPPTHYMGAVEAIDLVVGLVEDLRTAGAVYDVEGDLYFSVHADPAFGDVSGYDRTQMEALFGERGGDPQRPGKRDPLDCLVWQAARPGEPAWDSPFGSGRPGWHVECAAMALHHLGDGFDVQGGGSDLIFPHHEMSASEAQVGRGGARFARAYVHAGMVGYDGAKMSKSKGNLVLVSTLRDAGRDPMVLRSALLGRHYRSDWEWTGRDLETAQARVERWRQALRCESLADVRPLAAQARAALSDDLDAPGALDAVDAWAHATLSGTGEAQQDAKAVRAVLLSLVGLDL